jgi:adenylate kinase
METIRSTATRPEAAKLPAPATRMALVLFGPPGSGKGTQSKLLVERLGIPQISTGDMLRDEIRLGTEVGRSIEEQMRGGSLVPDDLVNRLVAGRLQQPDTQAGFILDGYPRTRQQAEVLLRLLVEIHSVPVVIHLVVDYNVIIKRISGRRQCPVCGTLYNSVSKPPRVAGQCDLDGTALIIRDDDRESVVRERLEEYESQTRPLIEFFRTSRDVLYELDASTDPPAVLADKILGLLPVRVEKKSSL